MCVTKNLYQSGLYQQLLFLISGVLIAHIHFTKAGSVLHGCIENVSVPSEMHSFVTPKHVPRVFGQQ